MDLHRHAVCFTRNHLSKGWNLPLDMPVGLQCKAISIRSLILGSGSASAGIENPSTIPGIFCRSRRGGQRSKEKSSCQEKSHIAPLVSDGYVIVGYD
jgi:hypothetical protein